MKRTSFNDTIEVNDSSVRMTRDGFLVADARVARTGIQIYAGYEVGRPEMREVRVYRPEAEVFHKDAMASYSHRPITNDHPPEMVTVDNWSKYGKGHTSDEVVRDGQFVRTQLIMMDKATIDAWKGGKKELSAGYDCELVFEDGKTPDGEQYDAYQKNISQNHLALVDRARGGAALRIGDDNHKGDKMSDVKTRTVIVDGIPVESTEAGAMVIDTLQGKLRTAGEANAKLVDTHNAAIAAKDTVIAAKDAEIEKLKAGQLTDAQLDARATARGDLLAAAKRLNDADYTGKTDAEVRSIVVKAKCGDAAVTNQSADYIKARFDILANDGDNNTVQPDAFVQHVKTGDGNNGNGQRPMTSDQAYAARVARLNAGSSFGNTQGAH